MKEEVLVIEEALTNGLRPDARTKIDEPFLEACYNLRPSPHGLVELNVPTVASGSYTETVDTRLLLGESEVMVIDTIASAFVLKKMTLSTRALGSDLLTSGTVGDASDDSGTVDVSAADLGNQFSYIETDGVWFITNGNMYLTNIDLFTATWNGSIDATSPVPTGVCMYNDRFVMCGLNTGGTAFDGGTTGDLQTLWTNVWEASRTFSEARGITSDDDAMNDSYVVIGSPSGGSSDVPFDHEMMLLSGYVEASHMEIVEAVGEGLILFLKIPWKGAAQSVAQLGDNIIVYGDHGIGIIRPIRGDSTQAQIAVEYFEVEQILDIGLMNPMTHIGDKTQQTFIDSRGDIWRINAKLELQKLGYREWMNSMATPADVIMSFDPREGDIYISDEVTGFLLTPTGLCTPRHILNSILPYNDGTLYGFWTVDDGDTNSFKTHPMDMGSRAIKLVGNISMEQDNMTSPTAHVDYKVGYAAGYSTNTLLALNGEGDIYAGQQGTDFKFSFASGARIADAYISRIRLRFKRTDKRRRRHL